MPYILHDITEGWTEPLEDQLFVQAPSDSAPHTFDATSMNLAIILRDKDGNAIAVAGGWRDQTVSSVHVDPAADTFVASKSPYSLHYQVMDSGGKVAYFPPGVAAIVVVRAK